MSGVEGAEREDYDDGEAGVGRASGYRLPDGNASTKGHEGKPGSLV